MPPPDRTPTFYAQDAPTLAVSQSIALTVLTQRSKIPGGVAPRHRKQLVISNRATVAANMILIYTAPDGPVASMIPPGTTWTVFSNADFWVAGATNSDWQADVLQIFYK